MLNSENYIITVYVIPHIPAILYYHFALFCAHRCAVN